MWHAKGGHKRSFKEKGRKQIDKSYQEAMRDRAKMGRGVASDGGWNTNCSPTGSEAGKHMYYGYKLQKKGGKAHG